MAIENKRYHETSYEMKIDVNCPKTIKISLHAQKLWKPPVKIKRF
jgi:hypothetical protein